MGAGFTPVEHPWNDRTADHDKLEKFMGLDSTEEGGVKIVRDRPDIPTLEQLINDNPCKEQILTISKKIVVDANIKHAIFLSNLINQEVEPSVKKTLARLFELVLDKTSQRTSANLIFDALFFPVQAFFLKWDKK